MSLIRRNPRRDEGEAAIVAALEAVGASVLRLSVEGCGDVLVGRGGVNWLLEVKGATGRLTTAQKAFAARWRGSYAVVRTPADALREIGVSREMDRAIALMKLIVDGFSGLEKLGPDPLRAGLNYVLAVYAEPFVSQQRTLARDVGMSCENCHGVVWICERCTCRVVGGVSR